MFNSKAVTLTLILVLISCGCAFGAAAGGISAGAFHTVSVKADGTVRAWGFNYFGQLGDGTTTDRSSPVQVKGPDGAALLTHVEAVCAGYYHTLALKKDGTVWGFGYNAFGQLGDGTTADKATPVRVKGPGSDYALTGVTAVASGSMHSLALKDDGSVWAWGYNDFGQLGNGTTSNSSIPVQVIGPSGVGFLTNVIAIAAGDYHAVALRSDGTVWAWGLNDKGQLGDGTTANKSAPVQVKGVGGAGFLTDITAVATGPGSSHTAALRSDGTVWTWGFNDYGQLGDATVIGRTTPVQVKGSGGTGVLAGVTAIAAQERYTLALKSDGTVWSWGYNAWGQLGDGTTNQRTSPVQVKGLGGAGFLTGVTAIDTGCHHSAAVKSDGTAWSWGYNAYGEIGDGTTTQRNAPVQVPGLTVRPTRRTAIAAGTYFTAATRVDGGAWTWGSNWRGQLGDGTTTNRTSPTHVLGLGGAGFLADITGIAGGYHHTASLRADGTAWCWGDNGGGQLGAGLSDDYVTTPVQAKLTGAPGFFTGGSAITAGCWHTVALKADGTVWAWGSDGYGELGQGTAFSMTTPVQVKGVGGSGFLTGIAAVTSSPDSQYTLAIRNDGTLWAWGFNGQGQLGDGTTTTRRTPIQVKGPGGIGFLTGVKCVATGGDAGSGISVAVKSDGTVWAWGDNSEGQLGDGTTTARLTPVQVVGSGGSGFLTGVVSVAAGDRFTLALKGDGTVWAWGNNGSGQLGIMGQGGISATPVQVAGGLRWKAIAAGANHALAMSSDGNVWAWGQNISGQFGDGTTEGQSWPSQTLFALRVGMYLSAWGYTSSPQITLSFSATGGAGTVQQMRISNDGVFDTEPWEAYTTSKSWMLSPGDGPKTIYARFRDTTGDEIDAVASIILDSTYPSIDSIVLSPPMAAAGDWVHVRVEASDNTGVVFAVLNDASLLSKTGDTTWEGDITAPASRGLHNVKISVYDQTLNVTTNESANYLVTGILGLTPSCAYHPIVWPASNKWLFKTWGRATIIDSSRFYLKNGLEPPVKVIAPGYIGIANGDLVSARGMLNPSVSPRTLTCSSEHVRKMSE